MMICILKIICKVQKKGKDHEHQHYLLTWMNRSNPFRSIIGVLRTYRWEWVGLHIWVSKDFSLLQPNQLNMLIFMDVFLCECHAKIAWFRGGYYNMRDWGWSYVWPLCATWSGKMLISIWSRNLGLIVILAFHLSSLFTSLTPKLVGDCYCDHPTRFNNLPLNPFVKFG